MAVTRPEPMNPLVAAWRAIADPRIERTAFFGVYLLHTIAGLALLFTQPRAADYVPYGHFVTVGWAALIIFGGILGMIAVLPGWNYIERVGVMSSMFGMSITAIFITLNSWSPAGLEVVIWGLITAWLFMFAFRLWSIRLYSVAPR